MAKHRVLIKYPERLPTSEWLIRLTQQYETVATRKAREALLEGRSREAKNFVWLAAGIRACVPGHEQEDLAWSTAVVESLLDGSAPTTERDDLLRRNEELAAQVRALRASASWRVTAPLRWVFRLLSGRSA
jgi:hypothetical protein